MSLRKQRKGRAHGKPVPGSVLLSLALFSFPLPSLAASVLMQPATTQIELGEPVRIEMTAVYPSRYELGADTQAAQTDPFVIRRIRPGPARALPEKRGGEPLKQQIWTITAVPFDTGDILFPSLSWPLLPGSQTLKSPPVRFQVRPPLPSAQQTAADIRDIKPPLALFPWLWVCLIALAVFLAGLLWSRRNRSSAPGRGLSPKDMAWLPPHEEALKRLEALLLAGSWERGEVKTFYNELADILRAYIQRRYEIPAMNLTTSGLLRQMRTAEIESNTVLISKQTLERCDLAKFAKYRPSDTDRDRDVEAVRKIILATTPQPDTVADAAGAAMR